MNFLISISAIIIFIICISCYMCTYLMGFRHSARFIHLAGIPIIVLSGIICIISTKEGCAAELVASPVTAEQVCEEYSVSYDYVKAAAEKTGQDELRVAYFCTYCEQNEWEVDAALHYIEPNLTPEEINEVICSY